MATSFAQASLEPLATHVQRTPAEDLQRRSVEGAEPRVSPLTTSGMIVGVMPDVTYTTKRHRVEGLGKLYLFSDGIYEVSNASGMLLPFDDFVKFNGEQGAKEAGKMRLEGKDYVVREGDVMHFRFNA